MDESKGLNQQTEGWASWSYVDSPPPSFASVQSDVKDYIPGQKTPETELTVSTSSSSVAGNFPIPSTIFYDDASVKTVTTLTESEAVGMVVGFVNDNDKKRKATTPPVASSSNKNPIKYNDVEALDAFDGHLYKNLDICIGAPLDHDTWNLYGTILVQVTEYMENRPCTQCGNIACTEKTMNTYSLVIAKRFGMIKEDGRYARGWADMLNNRYYRTDYHLFHQMLIKSKDEQPPGKCLKKLLTELFPAPKHLRAEGKLCSNHFLNNNPARFVFHEESMDAFFPLDDKYFVNGSFKLTI